MTLTCPWPCSHGKGVPAASNASLAQVAQANVCTKLTLTVVANAAAPQASESDGSVAQMYIVQVEQQCMGTARHCKTSFACV